MRETRVRAIAKSISWRILASLTTGILVLIFTGSWVLSLGITSFEVVSKMIFYYFHERLWDNISWQKK